MKNASKIFVCWIDDFQKTIHISSCIIFYLGETHYFLVILLNFTIKIRFTFLPFRIITVVFHAIGKEKSSLTYRNHFFDGLI